MTESSTRDNAPVLLQRVERLKIALRRSSVAIVTTDLLLAVAIALDISALIASIWFVGLEIIQFGRRQAAIGKYSTTEVNPEVFIRNMARWWAVLGTLRGAIALVAFFYGSSNTQMLTTIVVVGLAAGSIATSGGEVRLMRAWCYPAMGALAAGFASLLTWEGAVLAVLVILHARLLIGYVEFSGEQSAKLIENAIKLENERDRVRDANLELARLSNELRAERDRASEINAAKTRVLAAVSHDLRQPLFALSLNTTALGDRLQFLDDPYIARIEQGLSRGLTQCRSLLDQLVDFSRLEAGAVDVKLSAVETLPFLRAIASPYEAAAQSAGLKWVLEVDSSVAYVWTDASLLERLLGNLLQNAVKFTDVGQVGIKASLEPGDSHVEIEVFDDGPGIPVEDQIRVFEEFYQLDNPSRDRTQGIGLGLSIVKQLSAILGIGMKLYSAEGQGCRFVLRIPTSAVTPTSNRAPSSRWHPRKADTSLILVIDDELDLLADLEIMLSGRGYRVMTAPSEELACELAARQPPDIVLADYRLRHDRNGLEAVAAVRRRVGREIPAVIITGDTAPQRIAEVIASGLRVLHKPLDGNELAAAIEEVLRC